MAALEVDDTEPTSCCSPAAQGTCCDTEAKRECCGPEHEAGTCGCGADTAAVPEDAAELRDTVRERYAAAAVAASTRSAACCGEAAVFTDETAPPERSLRRESLFPAELSGPVGTLRLCGAHPTSQVAIRRLWRSSRS
jgi:hypothetical protein